MIAFHSTSFCLLALIFLPPLQWCFFSFGETKLINIPLLVDNFPHASMGYATPMHIWTALIRLSEKQTNTNLGVLHVGKYKKLDDGNCGWIKSYLIVHVYEILKNKVKCNILKM